MIEMILEKLRRIQLHWFVEMDKKLILSLIWEDFTTRKSTRISLTTSAAHVIGFYGASNFSGFFTHLFVFKLSDFELI